MAQRALIQEHLSELRDSRGRGSPEIDPKPRWGRGGLTKPYGKAVVSSCVIHISTVGSLSRVLGLAK